jgi:phosphate transport system protein
VVLALQNPMAVDLRFVTSALRIAGELERAGDLTKNIAKRSLKMEKYRIPEKVVTALRQIAGLVTGMLGDALSAIEARNPEIAVRVWSQDDAVDDLYHEILDTMQAEMTKDPKDILSCTHVVFAAKNFERIADYATSLAKTVYYVTSGEPPNKEALRAAFAAMQSDHNNAAN